MPLEIEKCEEQNILNASQLQRKTEIQTELMKIYELEELYWNERPKNIGLLKEDGNIEFFHRVANEEKRKNTIFSLQHGEEIIKEEKNLLKHATTYYRPLWARGQPTNST